MEDALDKAVEAVEKEVVEKKDDIVEGLKKQLAEKDVHIQQLESRIRLLEVSNRSVKTVLHDFIDKL